MTITQDSCVVHSLSVCLFETSTGCRRSSASSTPRGTPTGCTTRSSTSNTPQGDTHTQWVYYKIKYIQHSPQGTPKGCTRRSHTPGGTPIGCTTRTSTSKFPHRGHPKGAQEDHTPQGGHPLGVLQEQVHPSFPTGDTHRVYNGRGFHDGSRSCTEFSSYRSRL